MRKFADTHEWVEVETGKVGISAHAQKELGEIVYLQLPSVGKRVRRGEEIAVLESTKAAADIYAPVSGEVVAVNSEAADHPSTESGQWLFEIKMSHPSELDELLDHDAYESLIK